MALTMADASAVMLGAFHAVNRGAYFTACYTAAAGDANLQALIVALGSGTDLDENFSDLMKRIGDAVQELQAALPTIRATARMESQNAGAEVDVVVEVPA